MIDFLKHIYELFCIHPHAMLCDPITLTALAVTGGVMNVGANIAQGNAAKSAGDFNAMIAQQNAGLALQEGKENERTFRVNSAKQIGDIQANYAASGVSPEGSAMEVLRDSAATAELDALKVRHQGVLKSIGYEGDAMLARSRGDNAQQSGYLSAAGTLLSAGSGAYKTYKGY